MPIKNLFVFIILSSNFFSIICCFFLNSYIFRSTQNGYALLILCHTSAHSIGASKWYVLYYYFWVLLAWNMIISSRKTYLQLAVFPENQQAEANPVNTNYDDFYDIKDGDQVKFKITLHLLWEYRIRKDGLGLSLNVIKKIPFSDSGRSHKATRRWGSDRDL